jgi:hypothetical protein
MSMPSPPGTSRRWPQLLAFVVDDDDRTRRASLLLARFTICLLVTISVLIIIMVMLARITGWYTDAGGSIVALVVLLARTVRQRRAR